LGDIELRKLIIVDPGNKTEVSFDQLDSVALKMNDNQAVKLMNEAKRQLLKTIFGQNKKTG